MNQPSISPPIVSYPTMLVSVGDKFVFQGKEARMLGYALRRHGFHADHIVFETRDLGTKQWDSHMRRIREIVVEDRKVAKLDGPGLSWDYVFRRPTHSDRRGETACLPMERDISLAVA